MPDALTVAVPSQMPEQVAVAEDMEREIVGTMSTTFTLSTAVVHALASVTVTI